MILAPQAIAYNKFTERMWIAMQSVSNGVLVDQSFGFIELHPKNIYNALRNVSINSIPNIKRILSVCFYKEEKAFILIETNEQYSSEYYYAEIWEIDTSTHKITFVHRFDAPLCGASITDTAGIDVHDDKIYYTRATITNINEEGVFYLRKTPYIYDDDGIDPYNALEQKRYKRYIWSEYGYISDDDLTLDNPISLAFGEDVMYLVGSTGNTSTTHNTLSCMLDKYPLGYYDTNDPSSYVLDTTVDHENNVWLLFYNPEASMWKLGKMEETLPRRSLRQVGELITTENHDIDRFPFKYCTSCGTLSTAMAKSCRECNIIFSKSERLWYLIQLGYDNVDIVSVLPTYLDWQYVNKGRLLIDAATVESMSLRDTVNVSYEINDAFVVQYKDDYYEDDTLVEDEWIINTSDVIRNALITYEAGNTEWSNTNLAIHPAWTGEHRMFIYADSLERNPMKIELTASPFELTTHTVIEATILDDNNNPVQDQVVGFRFYKIPITPSVMQYITNDNEFVPALDPNPLVNNDYIHNGYTIKHTQNPTNCTGRATCILSRHHENQSTQGHVLVVAETEYITQYLLLLDPTLDHKIAINEILAGELLESGYAVD